eukprot:12921656-Prorocentrum_lima.AAC.1
MGALDGISLRFHRVRRVLFRLPKAVQKCGPRSVEFRLGRLCTLQRLRGNLWESSAGRRWAPRSACA